MLCWVLSVYLEVVTIIHIADMGFHLDHVQGSLAYLDSLQLMTRVCVLSLAITAPDT